MPARAYSKEGKPIWTQIAPCTSTGGYVSAATARVAAGTIADLAARPASRGSRRAHLIASSLVLPAPLERQVIPRLAAAPRIKFGTLYSRS
jgi:hypothetical protein